MTQLHKKYETLFKKYNVNSPERIAYLLGQLEHESNLKPILENLNYSSERLLKVFPKYFTKETVASYDRNPEKIANKVYSNRMGNGPEISGDGWKYRGRGFIQITGKNNYKKLTEDTGIDYLNYPDKLLTEADAMISALWYWNMINGNRYADNKDIKGLTKAINGGYNGLEDRIKKTEKWLKTLKQS